VRVTTLERPAVGAGEFVRPAIGERSLLAAVWRAREGKAPDDQL